ncbi:MAG: 50S ribosomal protein L30 [Coriobacteriia bacterium]|nr:50S ribosomal protein L30 [Coriobacteriia bacterium]
MAKKEAVKTLKITQIKSYIGTPQDQKRTVKALGLKRIGHSVEQADSAVIRGMVFKVKHLVKVEEL